MSKAKEHFRNLVDHVVGNFSYFHVDEEKHIVRVIFEGNDGIFEIVCKIDEDVFVVVILIPQAFPAGAHRELKDGISDVNNLLKIGSFLFDRDDGRILFRATSIVQDSLSDDLIRRLIVTSVTTCQNFQPAWNSVTFANSNGSEAVERVAKDMAARIDK